MKYVDRISHRLVNNVQRAISYVEMDNKTRAIEALRTITQDIQKLIRVVEMVREHERAS